MTFSSPMAWTSSFWHKLGLTLMSLIHLLNSVLMTVHVLARLDPPDESGWSCRCVQKHFNWRLLNSDHFSSFKVQLIKVGQANPLLITFVYCPPRIHKDFIPQFADFLSNTMPNFDKVLILGDLNIHVCCPSKPLVTDCMHLVESFNIKQLITGPTHKLGHTLDLVSSVVCQLIIWK